MENNKINNLSTELCFKKRNEEWDEFVSKVDGAKISQTSAWGKVRTLNKLTSKILRIIIRSEDNIVAGTQIKIRDYPFIGKIGIINQGPIFLEIKDEYIDLLIEQLKEITKIKKLLYLNIDVLNRYSFLPEKLINAGFKVHNKKMPPKKIMLPCTLIIDLTKNEETLMSEMNRGRRTNVRKGLKLDFTFKEGTRDDIATFYDLLKMTTSRKDTTPLLNIQYFYSLWDLFADKGWVRLHFAEVDGKPICGSFGHCFGRTYRGFQWGWNGEYGKEKISEAFIWKLIIWAKEKGFKHFDFVEIHPEIAEAIRSGKEITEELKSNSRYGGTFFKMQWGGKIVHYPGMFTLYKNKTVDIVLNFIYNKFLNHTANSKIIRILSKKR